VLKWTYFALFTQKPQGFFIKNNTLKNIIKPAKTKNIKNPTFFKKQYLFFYIQKILYTFQQKRVVFIFNIAII